METALLEPVGWDHESMMMMMPMMMPMLLMMMMIMMKMALLEPVG